MVLVVSKMPPDDFFLAVLDIMTLPGGGRRVGSSQAWRGESRPPPDEPQPTVSSTRGSAVMITSAWASGGSSVIVSARCAAIGRRDRLEPLQRTAGQEHRRLARGK